MTRNKAIANKAHENFNKLNIDWMIEREKVQTFQWDRVTWHRIDFRRPTNQRIESETKSVTRSTEGDAMSNINWRTGAVIQATPQRMWSLRLLHHNLHAIWHSKEKSCTNVNRVNGCTIFRLHYKCHREKNHRLWRQNRTLNTNVWLSVANACHQRSLCYFPMTLDRLSTLKWFIKRISINLKRFRGIIYNYEKLSHKV